MNRYKKDKQTKNEEAESSSKRKYFSGTKIFELKRQRSAKLANTTHAIIVSIVVVVVIVVAVIGPPNQSQTYGILLSAPHHEDVYTMLGRKAYKSYYFLPFFVYKDRLL